MRLCDYESITAASQKIKNQLQICASIELGPILNHKIWWELRF